MTDHLQLQEEELVFDTFDLVDAWCLGTLITERAIADDLAAFGWLDPYDYALTGGSFPIRLRGSGVVGAVTASGLTSEEDHDLVTSSIAAYLASASSSPTESAS